MRAYESSTGTLRALLAHPSLQKDMIDATMDALADANADAREIDESIRVGGEVATGTITDDDVEDELAALAREAEVDKMLSEIGAVPAKVVPEEKTKERNERVLVQE
jgi:charged multivesicular body protein 7